MMVSISVASFITTGSKKCRKREDTLSVSGMNHVKSDVFISCREAVMALLGG